MAVVARPTSAGTTIISFDLLCPWPATGGLVGGQVGYRWQATNWVFGLEAQGDWADLRGSNTSALLAPFAAPFGGSVANNTKVDAIGLFTGQVGYAWNN